MYFITLFISNTSLYRPIQAVQLDQRLQRVISKDLRQGEVHQSLSNKLTGGLRLMTVSNYYYALGRLEKH